MTFGGTEVVIGVTSRGSLMTASEEWPCGMGQSIAVRADSHAAMIEAFIAEHETTAPPPPDPDPMDPPPDDEDDGHLDPPAAHTDSGCTIAGRGTSDATGASVALVLTAVILGIRRRSRRPV
jgi:hypothetical protein